MVNGPEDLPVGWSADEWDSIVWAGPEREVGRLRQRIFKASREEDWPRVRNLQKLMLRSRAGTLVSVRRVAQRNAGRMTAGGGGGGAPSPPARGGGGGGGGPHTRRRRAPPRARGRPAAHPRTRRRQRPPGIPVLVDRCHQARVRNALEPEWEARFEPRSYGFRPGRSCQDAIRMIHSSCRGPHTKRVWVLDADLAAAFDRIDHDYLLGAL